MKAGAPLLFGSFSQSVHGLLRDKAKAIVMNSETCLNLVGMILPLCGIAFSAWSFRWAERGATPDSFSAESQYDYDFESEILDKGQRSRALICARTTFNVGALLLAAAVPMGAAANHTHDRVNGFLLSSCLIIAFALIYGVGQVIRIWRDRRENAFSMYFDSRKMSLLYLRGPTARIYFELNPMPIWTLLDQNWSSKRKLPKIDDVYSKAAKPVENVIT